MFKSPISNCRRSISQWNYKRSLVYFAYIFFVLITLQNIIASSYNQDINLQITANTSTIIHGTAADFSNILFWNTTKFNFYGLEKLPFFQLLYYLIFLFFLLLDLYIDIKDNSDFYNFILYRYKNRKDLLNWFCRQALKISSKAIFRIYSIFIIGLVIWLNIIHGLSFISVFDGFFVFFILYLLRMFLFYVLMYFILQILQLRDKTNLSMIILAIIPMVLLFITSFIPSFSTISYSEQLNNIWFFLGILILSIILSLMFLRKQLQHRDLIN